MERRVDVAVVGAGIVGLATARALLLREPRSRVAVLEKEPAIAMHQTGHNSGVIHSGAYYRPGSVKARCCVRGRELLLAYAAEHAVDHAICGKLVVATSSDEVPRLDAIRERARENGVPGVVRLERDAARDLEPEVGGVGYLHVPSTGMIDFPGIARAFADDVRRLGGEVETGAEVRAVTVSNDRLTIDTGGGSVDAGFLINCAGLQCDRLAVRCGVDPPVRIIPFRGEYYRLPPERGFVRTGHVYPVPDPELPFLGVHLTRHLDGRTEAGPNAVFAFAREGYGFATVHLRDLWESVSYPGFGPMVRRHFAVGMYENFRSFSRRQFAEDLARLVPAIRPDDLRPGGAGVRAQAVARDGALVDDFVVVEGPRSLHLLNAPSPAATSSMSIADELVARVPARP